LHGKHPSYNYYEMNGEVYIYIEYHDDDDISGKKKEFLLQFFFQVQKWISILVEELRNIIIPVLYVLKIANFSSAMIARHIFPNFITFPCDKRWIIIGETWYDQTIHNEKKCKQKIKKKCPFPFMAFIAS
jgi:hypothetical protein